MTGLVREVIVGAIRRRRRWALRGTNMARTKPPILPLSTLEPGQYADCFAILAERKPGTAANGKPYYASRSRDALRTAAYMAWGDGPHFAECEQTWQTGKCYKLRCTYYEHEKYGPQIEVHQIREA